jgi:ABC-2 type transport system permease protein
MRILDLAIKDLTQTIRDKQAFIFLLLMPITFTFFFGWIFGSFVDEDADPRLPVGWVNQNLQNELSMNMFSLLEGSDAIRLEVIYEVDSDQVVERVREGELAAAILIPDDFSLRTLSVGGMRLGLIADTTTQAGQTAVSVIRAGLARLLGSIQMAEISTRVYSEVSEIGAEDVNQGYFDEAFHLALQGWEQPPLGVRVLQQTSEGTEDESNPYAQASPGMIIQFTVFGIINTASILVIERKSKTLQRMMTTPISRAEMIGGHILAMFIVVFLQQTILVTMGQFLGLDYFREPLALLLLVASFALFATCYGLLVGVVAKSEEQVMMIGMLSMFLLTALAGAWFPLEITGEAFSAIGHLTPTAWAMDGFQNLILRSQGLESMWLSMAVILVYAGLCFLLALWRFKYE